MGGMLTHMKKRTTVIMDDELFRDVKVLAAKERCTVTSLVETALRRLIEENVASRLTDTQEPFYFRLPGTGGLRPGIDLANNAQVQEILDDELYGPSDQEALAA